MSSSVSQLYKSVIDDVINSVREVFLDESLDEHVLQELKQCWENKLMQSKAVPPEGVHVEHERVLPTQFTIQTQPQTTTAGNVQTAIKSTRGLQYKYTTAALQQLPAGNVVQPTLQYQCAPGDLNDASKTVTITLPQTVAGSQKPVTIALPASAFTQQGGGFVMSSPATAAASALPAGIAAGLLHPGLATINTASLITHQNSDGTTVQYQTITPEQLAKQGYTLNVSQAGSQQQASQVQQVHLANPGGIIQLDGARDTSDEDDDDEFKDDDDIDNDDDDQNDEENDGAGEEEEPLNSGDDVSDEDPSELFDTDNVIVCQYDKITRSRNKWKFHLKDGIMNLQGKDFVFQRAAGDAEW